MVGFVDETFRDGPQSLWATRMRTEAMLGAADWVNRAGFRKVCTISGASFETAVKFMRDDPWERLRLLRTCMPDATIDILIRSRNLFGWERYPDEVVELLFRCLRDTGAEWVKIFDGLNDLNNIAAHFRIAKQVGLKASGVLTFSLSPVHTDEYFAAKVRELVAYGVDSITMGDASGLLTGERTRSLMAALNEATGGKVPIEFMAHHSMGLAHDSYREAMKAGVDTIATASVPLANGESLPSTIDMMALAEQLGIETSLDPEMVRRTDDYFHWIAYQEGHQVQESMKFDPVRYQAFAGHQIPGGMMSNFRRQLQEIGLIDRIDEVLEEAGRVREEIGFPVMVTPFSQFVGVQAAFNVIHGERYKTVPKELYLYALGHYGAPPAPIAPDVLDRILAGKSAEPANPEEVFGAKIIENFKRDKGPFKSDKDLLLHLFYGGDHVEGLRREQTKLSAYPTVSQPLVLLIDHLVKEPSLRTISIGKGSLKLDLNLA
ncbi:MAG: hypothetical protein JJT90_16115 [Ectothiorhodospiraceae bacterium]|nr:hypothetical protein [Ectothiorhodospiraceae bacterium]